MSLDPNARHCCKSLPLAWSQVNAATVLSLWSSRPSSRPSSRAPPRLVICCPRGHRTRVCCAGRGEPVARAAVHACSSSGSGAAGAAVRLACRRERLRLRSGSAQTIGVCRWACMACAAAYARILLTCCACLCALCACCLGNLEQDRGCPTA